ncbi:MAG: hypothetical protein ACOCRN_00315 [Spirochaetia bacterium]
MRSYESLLALIQELEGDAREMERVLERNRTAAERIRAGAHDPVDYGALAFTIDTLYGVLENYFLRVSKYFENNLPSERWHAALAEKMRLDIPGVRPPVLVDAEQFRQVRKLISFRHKIRNLYGEDLDPGATMDAQSTVETFFRTFPDIHRKFIERLREIADAL